MAKSLASNCQVGRYEVESIVESIYVNDTKVMQQLSTRLENKTEIVALFCSFKVPLKQQI